MIITQTPLRIGLIGGGTDLPGYYRELGGRVLNCALDKYVYVILTPRFDNDIYVNYSKKEIVSRCQRWSSAGWIVSPVRAAAPTATVAPNSQTQRFPTSLLKVA